jgi:redox-sensitive bicupin YhaK (pirin superfamily)
MSTARSVLDITPLPEQRLGPGLAIRDARLDAIGPDLNPFIAVSLYSMSGPTFPPHPHAGFMVATYILPESEIGFVNQDSLGTRNRIAPGALHVTVAGSGVLHEEQPEAAGRVAQGFQIWIDLPDADRETEPRALSLVEPDVPRLAPPGAQVRVVLGTSSGVGSPLALPSAVSLLDVQLEAHAHWLHEMPAADHAFVFVLGGELHVGGHRATGGHLVRTAPGGDRVAFSAGAAGARFTVFAGTPLAQPRVMQGPFVASDRQQLARFSSRYALGAFGTLTPFAQNRNPGATP